jgi:hypothetical protein
VIDDGVTTLRRKYSLGAEAAARRFVVWWSRSASSTARVSGTQSAHLSERDGEARVTIEHTAEDDARAARGEREAVGESCLVAGVSASLGSIMW